MYQMHMYVLEERRFISMCMVFFRIRILVCEKTTLFTILISLAFSDQLLRILDLLALDERSSRVRCKQTEFPLQTNQLFSVTKETTTTTSPAETSLLADFLHRS